MLFIFVSVRSIVGNDLLLCNCISLDLFRRSFLYDSYFFCMRSDYFDLCLYFDVLRFRFVFDLVKELMRVNSKPEKNIKTKYNHINYDTSLSPRTI